MLPIKNFPLAGRIFAGCLAFLMPRPLLAGPIGDFAPLSVGHSWVYLQTDSSGSQLLAVTTLRVASRTQSGSAATYRLDVTDSLLRPGDTLRDRSYDIREQGGVITGITLASPSRPEASVETLVNRAFAAHTYDSLMTSTRTIDSVPRKVVEQAMIADGVNFSVYTESRWIRGVGLHTLSHTRWDYSFGSAVVTSYRFCLQRFNTEAFSTSVRPGARRIGPNVRKGERRRWIELGVDPLGRNLPFPQGRSL